MARRNISWRVYKDGEVKNHYLFEVLDVQDLNPDVLLEALDDHVKLCTGSIRAEMVFQTQHASIQRPERWIIRNEPVDELAEVLVVNIRVASRSAFRALGTVRRHMLHLHTARPETISSSEARAVSAPYI